MMLAAERVARQRERAVHMRIYDVIDKKKKGMELTEEEIYFAINGFVAGEIPDYQMAAFLMAIYFQGMTDRELIEMTKCMTESGDMADLSRIQGIKVDKHSTGGVGDKTTLVVGPLVAACGGKVAKMSGRGLGFTGGTIDKLESIPGLATAMDEDAFFETVNDLGLAIIGQSANIAPADKKLYALRDVTSTVDSIPLIAASIMSKKLAAGSDKIVLDVTVGSGAFMKSLDDALLLAEKMVAIGEGAGKETVAILTDMDVPLGEAVGNDIEIIEAIQTLQGGGPEDFQRICQTFSIAMLMLGGIGDEKTCASLVKSAIDEGRALDKLAAMVERQGGDSSYIYHPEKFRKAIYEMKLISPVDGFVTHMDTEACGRTAVILGAGRENKESGIDSRAGIRFYKKTGDPIRQGDVLARLYTSREETLQEGMKNLSAAYSFGAEKPQRMKSVLASVTKDGIQRY